MNKTSFHYLDCAGAALPTPALLRRVAASLSDPREVPIANPHSGHALGRRSRDSVQRAREKVLAHFGVTNRSYAVIFTANATAALKMVAEHFTAEENNEQTQIGVEGREFCTELSCLEDSSRCTLLMLRDSHTSVVGMRQIGPFEQIVVADFEELQRFLAAKKLAKKSAQKVGKPKRSLFVMTAMSNFCGRIYDFNVARTVKEVLGPHWSVGIDAAALALHSSDIGLSFCDFAVLSFYKMFGYPTDLTILCLGALLVRRSSGHCLQKRYFGGGTVKFVSPTSPHAEYRNSLEEKFEDGTCNFYAISALQHALGDECLQKAVSIQTIEWAERAFEMLTQLKHPNGAPIGIVYGLGWREKQEKMNGRKSWQENQSWQEIGRQQGPIVNFNLLREDGSFVGFVEVDKMADLFGIQLRVGCHCNLGACAMHLGLSESMMWENHQHGKECGDNLDLLDGKPLGSVRISFGRTSSQQDLDAFRNMLECCFIGWSPPSTNIEIERQTAAEQAGVGHLTHLFVYPIKSCAAMCPQSWPICPRSDCLLFDRNWLIMSCGGATLSQKTCPALCSILPKIDRNGAELVLNDRQKLLAPLRISLPSAEVDQRNADHHHHQQKQDVQNRIECLANRFSHKLIDDFGGSDWLGQLDDCLVDSKLIHKKASPRNFSNQSNFLLITRASALHLSDSCSLPLESVIERFRPNFVIDFGNGAKPFEEEHIDELSIGSVEFRVVGTCQRCQMICIDQKSGDKDPNVLIELRNLRKGRKLVFGIYLERKLELEENNNVAKKKRDLMIAREIHLGSAVRVLKWKKDEL